MAHDLSEARMHAECLNEAWCELNGEVSEVRRKVIAAEISARVWAVIYIIQGHKSGSFSSDAEEVIREANAFNGSDVPAETSDLH